MKKRKIISVTVKFSDGICESFHDLDAMFSESRNGRKGSDLEWTEYHITWVKYDEPPPVEIVKKEDRETLRGRAWCSVHGMEPADCFAQHVVPTAFSGREQDWKKEIVKIGQPNQVRAIKSVFPEFDLKDLMEGYGNGSVHT